jgi:deoxyribodipyrimidine photo-lyase
MWFRADLRTDDQPALFQALADADRGAVAVFALCPRQWRAHDWADARVEFLLRCVADLQARLRRLNVPLLLVRTPTFATLPEALLRLARRHACDALYFNREYEVHEQQRDAAVTARLTRAGLRVVALEDQTVLPPDALRTKSGGFYTVFTPFRRAWLARLGAAGGAVLLPPPKRLPALVCPPDELPARVSGYDRARGLTEDWPAGEEAARRRLDAFIAERVAAYRTQRDHPAEAGTSRLAPYLALGVLSPRRAVVVVRDEAGAGRAGPGCWLDELIWREFYRHVLVGYPRVSRGRAFRVATERLAWRDAEEDFAAWCAGRTGVPLVDAGMRQLAETAWMHNRVRMVTAMFLAKDLLIDWRRGERHFMRSLIDGDLANNNGGWQWSASTGTDAVPYFRIFNPYTQARRYDPEGRYIKRWVPELRAVPSAVLHDAARFTPALRAACRYVQPICDPRAARARALAAFRDL